MDAKSQEIRWRINGFRRRRKRTKRLEDVLLNETGFNLIVGNSCTTESATGTTRWYLPNFGNWLTIERKRSLSPLKDSPKSLASGPRSPAHSAFSRETKDSNETTPISTAVFPTMIKLMADSVDREGTIAYPRKRRKSN